MINLVLRMEQAIKIIRDQKEEVLQLQKTRMETQGLISDLLTLILNIQEKIIHSNQDFVNAVQRNANNCGIVEIVKVVSTIISTGNTMYGGIMAVVDNMETGLDPKTEEKNEIKDLKEVTENIDATLTVYHQIHGTVTPDSLKLISESEYKELLKPFEKLPEARILEADLDNYFNILKTRNSKIVELTSLVIRTEKLNSEIQMTKGELVRLQQRIGQEINSSLPGQKPLI